jgi:hypothetical protein
MSYPLDTLRTPSIPPSESGTYNKELKAKDVQERLPPRDTLVWRVRLHGSISVIMRAGNDALASMRAT